MGAHIRMRQRTWNRRNRHGTVVVEFAAVAPVLFLVIFACIEFGRALMAVQSLEEAARSGCRVAVLRGATTTEIEAEVDSILAPSGISVYTVQTQPINFATAERWASITVTVTASFDDMSWLPLPKYLSGQTYTASCTLPKEYSLVN